MPNATMKTYWDLTPSERAELADDAFARYIDIDLMQNGIQPVDTPVLMAVPEVPAPTREAFGIGDDIWFDTPEKAATYAGLGAMRTDYDYPTGFEYKKLTPKCSSPVVQSKRFYTDAELLTLGDLMKTAQEALNTNEKLLRDYKNALASRDEAVASILGDRKTQASNLYFYQRVRRTFEEYLGMTEGDHNMAAQFLCKAYPNLDANALESFTGLDISPLALAEPLSVSP